MRTSPLRPLNVVVLIAVSVILCLYSRHWPPAGHPRPSGGSLERLESTAFVWEPPGVCKSSLRAWHGDGDQHLKACTHRSLVAQEVGFISGATHPCRHLLRCRHMIAERRCHVAPQGFIWLGCFWLQPARPTKRAEMWRLSRRQALRVPEEPFAFVSCLTPPPCVREALCGWVRIPILLGRTAGGTYRATQLEGGWCRIIHQGKTKISLDVGLRHVQGSLVALGFRPSCRRAVDGARYCGHLYCTMLRPPKRKHCAALVILFTPLVPVLGLRHCNCLALHAAPVGFATARAQCGDAAV